MAIDKKANVRELVTILLEMIGEIEASRFKRRRNMESEATRQLVEPGNRLNEKK